MARARSVAIAGVFIATLVACGDNETTIGANRGESDSNAEAREPACEEVESFAEALVDVGITYDYEASDSPASLASSADVVFGGRLTGRTTSKEIPLDEDPNPRSFIGYEIAVTRVIKGTDVEVDDKVPIYVEYGATQHRDVDYYTEAVAPGAPVAILAFEDELFGGLNSSIEGFVISCPDGPLLGWTGSRGDWAALDTTEQVLDAADGAAEVSLDREEIETRERAWIAARPDAYAYEIETVCDCTLAGTFDVTVAGDEILGVRSHAADAEPYGLYNAPAIDTTFAMLSEPLALAEEDEIPTGSSSASFDPTYGYPNSFTIVGSEGLASYHVEIRDFTPLEPAVVDRVPLGMHLIISNQSFEDPDVVLTITVYGEVVVDRSFAVEGQHTHVAYGLPLEPGDHNVVIRADTGATHERVVTLGPERRYLYVGYWGDDPSLSPDPLAVQESDQPFGFG